MKQGSYYEISKQCKTIIRDNKPNNSIHMISEIKAPGGEKLGNEIALKIYNAYSDESVKYDSKKYENNINSYKNKVNANIAKATNSVKHPNNN